MLSDQALQLMPDPGSLPRCAEFSETLGVDPAGSAISAGLVLAVETPLPWPKPVFKHELLDGAAGTPSTVLGTARLLAAVPESADTVGRIRAWWREDGETVAAELRIDTNAALLELLGELEQHRPDQCAAFIAGSLTRGDAVTPAVLICTQGSHDICCGTEGTRLAMQAQADLSDIHVLRVSHTGGHRFSPTAMTLPDGRMWAHLDLDDVRSILSRTGDPAELAPKCRGWWAAGRGEAQVAERAVFADRGWEQPGENRTVTMDPTVEGRYLVQAGAESYGVTVGIKREIPTIACRALGGMPAKPGREYHVVDGPSLVDDTATHQVSDLA